MAVQIQARRGTATEWSTENPVLASGEPGLETDTGLFKWGNGTDAWNALDYAASGDNATGGVVQVVTSTSSTQDTTTSTSFQNTSLAVSITPKYADSTLVAYTSGRVVASRVSGSPTNRFGFWQIWNATDGVALDGAETLVIGRGLVAASSEGAASWFSLAIVGRYVVNSTAERTIRVRFSSGGSGLQSELRSHESTALIVVQEVRA